VGRGFILISGEPQKVERSLRLVVQQEFPAGVDLKRNIPFKIEIIGRKKRKSNN